LLTELHRPAFQKKPIGAASEQEMIAATPQRACGDCSLCCKLLRIASLDKPNGKWCSHCKAGKGCDIYESRPQDCRDFDCSWLTGQLGDAWYPLNAKLVIDMKGPWVMVHVDPSVPNRWREEPYFSQIQYWAAFGVDRGVWVLVFVKKRVRIILPNKEIDLGTYESGDFVIVGEVPSPAGRDWRAVIRNERNLTPEERNKFAIR
jgi:hypothetical protein